MLSILIASVCCLAPVLHDPPKHPLPRLDQDNLAAWMRYVLPTPDELLFETVPWRPSFAEGLHDAADENKPLLLWVMNGHPLGCT